MIRFDAFCAPIILENNNEIQVDVWAMFSPADKRAAKKAFNYFFNTWIKRETVYDKEAYSLYYSKQVGSIITSAIKYGAAQEPIINWKANKKNQVATISELNIEKYYFNTHRYFLRSEYEDKEALTRNGFIESVAKTDLGFFSITTKNLIYDYLSDEEGKTILQKTLKISSDESELSEIFYVAAIGDCKRMRELIDFKMDINQQATKPNRLGETPLHLAILHKHFEMTMLLLESNARTDLVAKYWGNPKEWRAYDMILALPTEDDRKRFTELYESVMVTRNQTQTRNLI